MNSFLEEAYRYSAYTENGAVSHNSTGSDLLNYFSNGGVGTMKWYGQEYIDRTFEAMWSESPLITLQIIFYYRMITRQIKGSAATETVQRGQGNKSEFRTALKWFAKNDPDSLYKNIWLVPEVGCWKDLWHRELIHDLSREHVYALIEQRLEDPYHRELLAKYLPRIRSKANTKTKYHGALNQFAYGLIKRLGWTPVQYRKFKASGKAHDFQRQMCRNEWDQLEFGRIPGKALSMLTAPREQEESVIELHGQAERYQAWIDTIPVAKFTGYPHELVKRLGICFFEAAYGKIRLNSLATRTADKQFEGLLATARKDVNPLTQKIWVAIDTSGSMGFTLPGGSDAIDVAIAMGIYFSSLIEGAFQNHVILFDDVSRTVKLKGSFSNKVLKLARTETAWGSTNFQSVIDEIIRIRTEHPEIPVEEYPSSLLVITDLQFNPAGNNSKTNSEVAMEKLRKAGLPDIQIIWWNVAGRAEDRPNQQDDDNVMMLSGFDGAILAHLLNKEPEEGVRDTSDPDRKTSSQSVNPYATMLRALNQEILTKIRI